MNKDDDVVDDVHATRKDYNEELHMNIHPTMVINLEIFLIIQI